MEISATPARRGATAIELPPLGRIRAETHRAPAEITARVVGLDVDEVQRVATASDPVSVLSRRVEADLDDALRRFALRTVFVALIAGAVAGLVLPRRHWTDAVASGTGGVVVVLALLVATWAPYDRDAFREPTFEGELARAPAIVDSVERHLGGLEAVRGRVAVVSDRISELYAASVDVPLGDAGADEVAILHVSDLHLNPLGIEIALRLADDFAVDAVLDTGDLTSFGLPLESRIGNLLARSTVPWYFVPGNHDSPANRREIASVDPVVLVDREIVDIEGVRVLGVADPTFTATNELTRADARAVKLAQGGAVRRLVEREEPDVLAVHDPIQAEASHGAVPLVVAGHVHERMNVVDRGTRVLTVGSSGATGLGSFTVETDLAYEAQILRFREGRLVAVDHVSLTGIGGDFTLEREVLDGRDGGAEQGGDQQGATG